MGIPSSVSCPVYRNVNDKRVSSFGICLKRMCISVCKFRMTFTWAKKVEKVSHNDQEFSSCPEKGVKKPTNDERRLGYVRVKVPCCLFDRLVGLVVRRPPQERKIPGSNPVCAGIFSGSSHTSDFKIDTPVATLPGAWRYKVSTGTGRSGVNLL